MGLVLLFKNSIASKSDKDQLRDHALFKAFFGLNSKPSRIFYTGVKE